MKDVKKKKGNRERERGREKRDEVRGRKNTKADGERGCHRDVLRFP